MATARARVYRVLQGITPGKGPAYIIASNAVVIIAVLAYCLRTLPNLPPAPAAFLLHLEYVILILFMVDYAVRVWAAPSRSRYIFSFWGLVDLLAFLPALITAGMDLSSARLARLLQLARLLKIVRLTRAVDYMLDAFAEVKDELLVFLATVIVLLFLASVGIYHFERHAQPDTFASVPHAMWWAVATLTTVGYGDIVPITAGGRIFTGFVLMIGLGIIAVPTAIISAALVTKMEREKQARRERKTVDDEN